MDRLSLDPSGVEYVVARSAEGFDPVVALIKGLAMLFEAFVRRLVTPGTNAYLPWGDRDARI
jgi:hypothetical protein